jgi:hypothetical protein
VSDSEVKTQPALPRFFRVRQHFAARAIKDVEAAVVKSLDGAKLTDKIQPDQSVAIATGSRGIASIDVVVQAVVRYVQAIGARPFIVPAMGSHGGATAEGQSRVLASLGITAESMGCPIESSMETVVVGTADDTLPIHFDRFASQADHVIVINRIKSHTRLVGDIESGLNKMLMIGLGKHRGAITYHQAFANYEYQLDRIARSVVPVIVRQLPITLGIAIVEDAFDCISRVEAIEPENFLAQEPRLLQLAREGMARLPFDHADLLIVDRIGKEISGTGMDTNVVGRKANDRAAAENEVPKIREIFVRSLTEKTNGNATGIGIAEYCRTQVPREMNLEMTRINCITSGHVSAGAVPLHFESDREVLDAALPQARDASSGGAKWMWIRDTLHLSTVACSQAYWAAAQDRDDLDVIDSPRELDFDSAGNLDAWD